LIPWDAPSATGPVQATISVPGSKSTTARAFLLAALADGPSTLTGVLEARDTQLMRAALTSLGAEFGDVGPGSVEVTPPPAFRAADRIDCGLSGTVLRFVPPLAAFAEGTTAFHGDPEASQRPVYPLLRALDQLGARVGGDRLPFTVTGPVGPGGAVTLDSSASSQFVSALLLAGCRFADGLTIRHRGGDLPSRPHVAMTVAMLRARGVVVEEPEPDTWVVAPGRIRGVQEAIEPDLTNAATFLAAALVTRGRITTAWPEESVQPGDALLGVLSEFGATISWSGDQVTVDGTGGVRGAAIDLHEVSEITCVAAALATLASGPSRITGVGHIRGHETDRLAALEAELNRLGGCVAQTADGLRVLPTRLHGGWFSTHADHRLAHAGALIALAVPGVRLDDVGCTTKTLPDFVGLWSRMLGAAG